MRRVGGIGELKNATAEVQQLIEKLKSKVEEKADQQLSEFIAKSYATQVVAGTNYFVKVSVGGGSFLHLRIYKDLGGNVSLHSVQKGKTECDMMEYF